MRIASKSLLRLIPRESHTPRQKNLFRFENICASTRRFAVSSKYEQLQVSPSVTSLLKNPSLLNSEGLFGHQVKSDDSFKVLNPATGEVLATLPRQATSETRSAIETAVAAFPAWRDKTAKERSIILKKWHNLIVEHKDDISILMTLECGKPLVEAANEIGAGISSVEWFAEEAKRIYGDVLEPPSRDRRLLVLKQPVGVVGAITPWNFPMSMITRKVAPALAAGCPVVLKPAESTPLTAIVLANLAIRAGVPKEVFTIVVGDANAIGEELTSNQGVRKIGFTGSTAVGKKLAAAAAVRVKRVSLELGGNAPFIVFEDADLDKAAAGIIGSALRNAGQTCICANRVFVADKIYDKLSLLVKQRVAALKVGSGLDNSTTIGPLINAQGVSKVARQVEDAVNLGARILIGGNRPEGLPDELAKGHFFAPTVLADVTKDMLCYREETFGPLVPLFRFKTDEEVIKLANDTQYGLAAYFYTKDLARAWHVAEHLEYGMVGINEAGIVSEVAPFGGVKESGLGRENGRFGLEEFLSIKYVCMGLGK
eukprot:CAMPEP_0175062090 /NCGR_PEP_ID=MMETSP0052_2-20121109/13960_1 /TAXON_ID=51329 ORGANISM="Polytomella parva, Strain SAG 63-3" /NCGR_SAMPLE_ID=MMETSP0052_2 /ASSEMBLY_ACC=CAM_ASM_000194 /LENGTH=540 /DNA_ID=CAMNT_0016328043 /DNA_START=70 /DNA_END=1692 /DNA_ORIENTATION=+